MKKLLILGAVAAALAFASSNARASSNNLVLNITGTAVIQKTNTQTATAYVGTTAASSFSNKQIYSLISNAVANVSTWAYLGAITPATLPADGYIVFNPDPSASDGEVTGVFYVTNKTGFYYPLSGFDAYGYYYSWMELDLQNAQYAVEKVENAFPINLGWCNTNIELNYSFNPNIPGNAFPVGTPFNGVSSYNINGTTGNGLETETLTALLYIHDDPYSYDDADDPDIFWEDYLSSQYPDDNVGFNANAIEIRGIATLSLTWKGFNPKGGTISLTGSGNMISKGNFGYVVKTATATFK